MIFQGKRQLTAREEQQLHDMGLSGKVLAVVREIWEAENAPPEKKESPVLDFFVNYLSLPGVTALLFFGHYYQSLGLIDVARLAIWVAILLFWICGLALEMAISASKYDLSVILGSEAMRVWHKKKEKKKKGFRIFIKGFAICIVVLLAYGGYFITAFVLLVTIISVISATESITKRVDQAIAKIKSE